MIATVRISWIYAVLGLAFMALLRMVAAPQDFNPNAHGWEGVSGFVSRYNVRPEAVMPELHDANTVLVVLPRRTLTREEFERVQGLLMAGGTVLLLDDFGHGSVVAADLGVSGRFAGKPLLDPLINVGGDPQLPLALGVPDTLLGAQQELPRGPRASGDAQTTLAPGTALRFLALDRPTALTDVPNGNVLAVSGPFAFIDENANGSWDAGEPSAALPVAASFPVGRGTLVMVADPSAVINGLIDRNAWAFDGLIRGRPTFWFDAQPNAGRLEQVQWLFDFGGAMLASPLGSGLVVLGLVAAISYSRLGHSWRRRLT